VRRWSAALLYLGLAGVAWAEITSFGSFPGGQNGSLQYNHGQVFDGVSGSSVAGSTVTVGQVVATTAAFGASASRSTFTYDGSLTMAAGSTIAAAYVTGNGAGLTGIPSSGAISGIQTTVDALGVSTGVIKSRADQAAVSTAAIAAVQATMGQSTQAAAVAISTTDALLATVGQSTQATAVAVSTTGAVVFAIGQSSQATAVAISTTGAAKVDRAGDRMTGPLQIAGSSLAVTGGGGIGVTYGISAATIAATGAISGGAITGSSGTLTQTSAFSLYSTSGIFVASGPVILGPGSYLRWPDLSVSTTASSGSGGGGSSFGTAGTTSALNGYLSVGPAGVAHGFEQQISTEHARIVGPVTAPIVASTGTFKLSYRLKNSPNTNNVKYCVRVNGKTTASYDYAIDATDNAAGSQVDGGTGTCLFIHQTTANSPDHRTAAGGYVRGSVYFDVDGGTVIFHNGGTINQGASGTYTYSKFGGVFHSSEAITTISILGDADFGDGQITIKADNDF
jgi:hypothetical protein